MGGQSDDCDVCRGRVGLELPRELEAIHPWQLDVHEDQIRRLTGDELDRVFGGAGGRDVETLAFERGGCEQAARRIVLDDQHKGLL